MVQKTRSATANLPPQQLTTDLREFSSSNSRDCRTYTLLNSLFAEQLCDLGDSVDIPTDCDVQQAEYFSLGVGDDLIIVNVGILLDEGEGRCEDGNER